MRKEMKKLIVCGSTGKQGGAVIDAMLGSSGWELSGFSRHPESPQAKTLKSLGVMMQEGDLGDLDSLKSVFHGADCVFAMTQPWNKSYTKVDTGLELKQGSNIVEACKATGIRYLVFSSALHEEDEKMGLPHVDIKIEIESLVKNSGLHYTFLYPVQFMDNVGMKFLPVKKGKIRGFIDSDAKVPYVAVKDIGLIARAVLENPEPFPDKEIPLIGDLVSGQELAAILEEIRKEKFKYRAVPRWIIRLISREFYQMRLKFEEAGRDEGTIRQLTGAMEKCRELNPDMMTMKAYLETEGWRDKQL